MAITSKRNQIALRLRLTLVDITPLWCALVGKAKNKGKRNEYRSMRYLEGLGYYCTLSSASLGIWDIIALNKTGGQLVQVKSNRWPPKPERLEMEAFNPPPGFTKVIHRWRDYSREPDIRILD